MLLPSNIDEFLPVRCNTGDAEIFANVEFACSLPLPWLDVVEAHDKVAVIVGGGPSLRGSLPMIRARQKAGQHIVCLNGSMNALASEGILADFYVMLEAREESARQFLSAPIRGAKYFLASQCHPSAFAAVAGEDVVLWHPLYPGIEKYTAHRDCAMIGGGTSVGLLAMSILWALGYRTIHLYGLDSSYEGDEGHAYAQPLNAGEPTAEYEIAGRKFRAAPWMARQAMEFQGVAAQLSRDGVSIAVHGDGLLPAIAKELQKRAEAPLTVLCVYRSGGVMTKEWVYRLRDGVARNLTVPYRFMCLSDKSVPGVECLPLEYDFPRMWAKAELFSPKMDGLGRILYIDLATVITGNIDGFATYSGEAVTRDFYHGGPSQSVLLYEAKNFRHVWDAFIANPSYWISEGDKMIAPHFADQILFTRLLGRTLAYWQDVLPGRLVSYKVHCQDGLPPNARMVKFHGKPKPHEISDGTILRHWKQEAALAA